MEVTISALLDKDEERLLRELKSAGTGERAEAAVSRELDALLLAYNAAGVSDRQRAAAAAMTETARSCAGLLDTRGQVRVWERSEGKRKFHLTAPTAVLALLGSGLNAAACGVLRYGGSPGTWVPGALLAAGAILYLLAGFLLAKDNAAPAAERRTEVETDWDKVFRVLRAAALVMDRSLEETASQERWERREQGGPAELPADELELFESLLEAAYSGDGAFALDRLASVRHFLHTRGVETAEYGPGTAEWFDVMPGTAPMTLRPALTREGKPLRRGLAADVT